MVAPTRWVLIGLAQWLPVGAGAEPDMQSVLSKA